MKIQHNVSKSKQFKAFLSLLKQARNNFKDNQPIGINNKAEISFVYIYCGIFFI